MSTSRHEAPARAVDVAFLGGQLIVDLADGRRVQAPLEWFPRLRAASPEELRVWRRIGNGEGIHWPALDEDLSVAGLLRGTSVRRGRTPLAGTTSRDAKIQAALAKLSDRESTPITPETLRTLLRKASEGFAAEAG